MEPLEGCPGKKCSMQWPFCCSCAFSLMLSTPCKAVFSQNGVNSAGPSLFLLRPPPPPGCAGQCLEPARPLFYAGWCAGGRKAVLAPPPNQHVLSHWARFVSQRATLGQRRQHATRFVAGWPWLSTAVLFAVDPPAAARCSCEVSSGHGGQGCRITA